VTTLTQSDRARLYAVMLDCPYSTCGARRGEFCESKNGKVWEKSWHGQRGYMTQYYRRHDPKFNERYEKLRRQIVDQREVVGHE